VRWSLLNLPGIKKEHRPWLRVDKNLHRHNKDYVRKQYPPRRSVSVTTDSDLAFVLRKWGSDPEVRSERAQSTPFFSDYK